MPSRLSPRRTAAAIEPLTREREPDIRERYRRLREDLSRGLEAPLRDLHALRAGPHLGYAVFPLMLAAGFALMAAALARPGLPLSLYLPGLALAALGMNSCFLLIHEAVHGILFRNPILNRAAGMALSAIGLISFTAYQVLHLRHHDFLGDPRDPDDYENYTRRPLLLWALHGNRLIWGTVLYVLVFPYVSMRCAGQADRRRIAAEYALLAILAAGLLWALPARSLLLAWLAPFLLANWMINIRGFSQHGIAVAKDPLLASRTMLPHPFVRRLLINENYHLEHHLFPGVPGYNLPALHRLLEPRIPRRVLCASYAGFLLRFLRQAVSLDARPIGLVSPPPARDRGGREAP